ncbi:MmgE/PrpD family protein [Arthrobacter sp. PAMC25564]|nr:MmgE/PrpD family protein [Arthrobacter sp. PAMC25564]
MELVHFIRGANLSQVPEPTLTVVKQVLLTVCGTALAGADQDGIAELRDVLVERAGRPEAHLIVFGDALPALSVALLNGAMARALDYCDAMVPGLHLGSGVVPAALAAAELNGGCSGEEFLAALVVGMETGSRLNLTEELYDGFDPTGVAGVMGATAAAARVCGLDETQTVHALALAFNRCGGSFQSNIDGSLAVRLINGWIASVAIECVQYAAAGLTGPMHFLSGTYGYAHLFARGQIQAAEFVRGLTEEWHLLKMVFKKYPSCGLTQGATELALQAVRDEGIGADEVDHVDVFVPPYSWRLVGQPFKLGPNPRVDAQFSAQSCVASAFERKSAVLGHFEPDAIGDLMGLGILDKVASYEDETLDEIGHTACRLVVHTIDGREWTGELAVAPGFPGNELEPQAHVDRFLDCWDYAKTGLPGIAATELQSVVADIETLDDARSLLNHLLVRDRPQA